MRKNAIVVGAEPERRINIEAQLTKKTPINRTAAPRPADNFVFPLVKFNFARVCRFELMNRRALQFGIADYSRRP